MKKVKLNSRAKMSLTGPRLSRLEASAMKELEDTYELAVVDVAMRAATQALSDIGIDSVHAQPYAAVKAIVVKAVMDAIIRG